MITQQLIINLLLILVVAWFIGGIFARFGFPVMLGELLAGIILGPPMLGIVNESPALELIATPPPAFSSSCSIRELS